MRRTFGVGIATLSDEPQDATYTGDGVTTTFTLPATVDAQVEAGVAVYRNGLRLVRTSTPTTKDEYSVSGNTLTLGAAPGASDTIFVQLWT